MKEKGMKDKIKGFFGGEVQEKNIMNKMVWPDLK